MLTFHFHFGLFNTGTKYSFLANSYFYLTKVLGVTKKIMDSTMEHQSIIVLKITIRIGLSQNKYSKQRAEKTKEELNELLFLSYIF